VLNIGPKRGAFCGTNSVCILLAAISRAVWLDKSVEGSHCCISASTLKSSVLLTSACSNTKEMCWIFVATVVTWTGHGDRLHVRLPICWQCRGYEGLPSAKTGRTVNRTASVNNALDLCLEGVWFESNLERIFQECPRRILCWSRERFVTDHPFLRYLTWYCWTIRRQNTHTHSRKIFFKDSFIYTLSPYWTTSTCVKL
jgi:hypothetical protein